MNYPLMKNNILQEDLNKLINFLKSKKDKLILTNSKKVLEFERKWSKWLGVKYSIFVNSGASANLLTMSILKLFYPKGGEVIVPPFTWSSDINSIIQSGFTPRFVDIKLENLAINENLIERNITKKTKAIFLTHAQGFNGLSNKLLHICKKKKICLIEDACESHGATFKNRKVGTFGLMSNFSFYYAHHMSTIEGGMVCTNSSKIYQMLRSIRSHGLLRESNDENYKKNIQKKFKDLNKEFIFLYPGYNFRSTEINAVLGISQLKRLDQNIKKRNNNCKFFLKLLKQDIFFTDFNVSGMSNYAFNLILRKKNKLLFEKIKNNLKKNKIEFRAGSIGGGNQIRQPYLKNFRKKSNLKDYKITEHIHFFSLYIGNYPELKKHQIKFICNVINQSI